MKLKHFAALFSLQTAKDDVTRSRRELEVAGCGGRSVFDKGEKLLYPLHLWTVY